MEKYNYQRAIKNDILEYIKDNYTSEENDEKMDDSQAWGEELYDALWVEDGVTGNASGSYTFSTWQAEENLCHNWDLLEQALDEVGGDFKKAIANGAEYCDVTIRCYLLCECIADALNELE